MQSGAFVIVIQVVVALNLFGLGLWALFLPKKFQLFVNMNFALLPAVKDGWQLTPMILRIFGLFLLWYGCYFAAAFGREISWLGWLFRVA